MVVADTIVRSTAMFAETIAEYYVEEDQCGLELEIGEQDIASFRNLLPDTLYQQLDFGDAPLEDRLSLFTTQDMAIFQDGKALQGFVREIGPATRPKRDDVTGEELLKSQGDSMTVDSRWSVFGSVGHWGHIHQRKNGYHARLEITEIDGMWKLTRLEILQEERL